ncbi:hypothetical protein BJ508DRAFT_328218 [Ascobolus immersus RN42]|uniref:Uncharacterized protein n=1 Tax=Ascobolus immersus RN42 TaxID=1160509 RepID=A0A3N4I266_ASCIM|nr:hypothetical protein BJ508DRAFT_328218 [Ascobolus immersus RN42]
MPQNIESTTSSDIWYNPKCGYCKLRFNEEADKLAHLYKDHFTSTYDAYEHKGGYGIPYIVVMRSADFLFHCAVDDCDYSVLHHSIFQTHCEDEHLEQTLTFKKLRLLTNAEKKKFSKSEARRLAQFLYKKETVSVDFVDLIWLLEHPGVGGMPVVGEDPSDGIFSTDFDTIYRETKSSVPQPESPPEPTENASFEERDTMTPTATIIRAIKMEHAVDEAQMSRTTANQPNRSNPTIVSKQAEVLKTETDQSIAQCRTSFIDLTDSDDEEAAAVAPLTRPQPQAIVRKPVAPRARASVKRKRDEEPENETKNLKAAAKAMLHKKVQEEYISTMGDSNGDPAASLKRIEQYRQLYEKTMEIFGSDGCDNRD